MKQAKVESTKLTLRKRQTSFGEKSNLQIRENNFEKFASTFELIEKKKTKKIVRSRISTLNFVPKLVSNTISGQNYGDSK